MSASDCHNEKEGVLARRLVGGDVEAFDEIYRLYFHPVFNNAVRITRDSAVAEDILQEVFITLWEKRATIDPEKSLGGWLFTLCYHRSINMLKQRLRESLLKNQLPTEAESEDEVKFGVRWTILENALSHLSPQRRRVFELCKLQGKSYEEAAAELHISKYTVKEYLSAALVSIREYSRHHPESAAFLLSAFLFI